MSVFVFLQGILDFLLTALNLYNHFYPLVMYIVDVQTNYYENNRTLAVFHFCFENHSSRNRILSYLDYNCAYNLPIEIAEVDVKPDKSDSNWLVLADEKLSEAGRLLREDYLKFSLDILSRQSQNKHFPLLITHNQILRDKLSGGELLQIHFVVYDSKGRKIAGCSVGLTLAQLTTSDIYLASPEKY